MANYLDILPKLLAEAGDLRKSQQKKRKENAEEFNFFTALCRASDENKHSRFIASLLNPRGQHGRGELFLQYFLEELDIKTGTASLGDWRVETEAVLPGGRRIDLLLTGSEQIIGIENKVHADEGNNQLEDYATALPSIREDATLVFVTPNGREPESGLDTLAAKGSKILCCSYANNSASLLNWINRCTNEVTNLPRLKEILGQYAEILNRIGGKTMKLQERQEMANLLMDHESFAAAEALTEALAEVRIIVQERFWKTLSNCLTKAELQPWTYERSCPDRRAISDYYGGKRNRQNLGLDYETSITWHGLALILRIELLKDHSRPLTYKLICRDLKNPHKELIIPRQSDLAAKLCKLRGEFKTSQWSLATADIILPSQQTLDLAFLSGEAQKLLSEPSAMRIAQDIVVEAQKLIQEASAAVEELSPTA